ncbi:MAG: hypothetical protein RL681_626, partial [Candidatus Parcubacteria bacterium]
MKSYVAYQLLSLRTRSAKGAALRVLSRLTPKGQVQPDASIPLHAGPSRTGAPRRGDVRDRTAGR